MSKQDVYRFNLRFDETDEDHRKVCEFLNSCGRKKARYVVKAILAYWALENRTVPPSPAAQVPDMQKEVFNPSLNAEKQTEAKHFVDLDDAYETDDAEVSLMLKNYKMFDNIDD